MKSHSHGHTTLKLLLLLLVVVGISWSRETMASSVAAQANAGITVFAAMRAYMISGLGI